MRRVTGVGLDLDDLGVPSAPRRRRRKSAKAGRWRWPSLPRSRSRRRLVQATLLVLAGAILLMLFPASRVAQGLLAWSASAGFRVDDIYVVGRAKTPAEQLRAALAVKPGDAILAIDLPAARRRIEAITWVRSATVQRRLPNQICLAITEREPIALWQNKGRYYLVDRDGQILSDQTDAYPGLPLMVGTGAPDHAAELVALLQAEPALQARVAAATWVGERRWNVTLDLGVGGIEVRLPEEGAIAAWHDLAQLDRDQNLLERQVGVIDLRLPDRLVLRAAPGDAKPKSANGKDA